MNKPFVKILYTEIRPIEHLPIWHVYTNKLSEAQQTHNQRFIKWEDRCRSLFGKMLINHLLVDFGYSDNRIPDIQLTEYGRPHLDIDLDFNVSHSGDYVVCAASTDCRVGIDIEKWTKIDFREFRHTLTENEWQLMNQTRKEDHPKEFFRIWTQKESVIKADGRGLSWPLDKIEANDVKVIDKDNSWYVHKLEIQKEYSAWLATDQAGPQIEFAAKIL